MLAATEKRYPETRLAEERVPTRLSAALFRFKVWLFRIARTFKNVRGGPAKLASGVTETFLYVAARSTTRLRSDLRRQEHAMQNGKIENLRVAARRLDRTLIPAGEVFSFWRQLGPPSRRRGFVSGRMLQQGCIVPATGGGLCQLSNALFDVALNAGCEIVERHAHSRVVQGSATEQGRDATVAWNYVDLRFQTARPLLLRVQLTADELVVSLRSTNDARPPVSLSHKEPAREIAVQTCGTCNETNCFRHEQVSETAHGRAAFLMNEAWPEFAAYLGILKTSRDSLYIPLDGARWRIGRHSWSTSGFGDVTTATACTLKNSIAVRRLADQGAERRRAELRAAEAIARSYARRMKLDASTLYVTQSLLPFLWRAGCLGGRRFRVLMTALPMRELQRRLDDAARAFPDRATLSDFRAPADLLELEAEALSAADAVITPHSEIAAMFPNRAVKLEWQGPEARSSSHERFARRIAFPGPTVARKGCYELRAAARALDLEIAPLGNELEGKDFWSDTRIVELDRGNWLNGISLVVQPAIVEQAPRRLLTALAARIPVIATPACGLDPQPGLTLVPPCDSNALAAAISKHLN
jgi:VanW like protein/glycosyl transferase family 1